ncbi:uncharacterized protein LOC120145109 [Hibiscus syriacus]|uniref:uncharacterized protein LOC120145109 n=1 Tax=Hibiscus syriacus TaxID=106335 RepID=UPI001920DCCC|nr:uncharacterized protein LOC120145109 [Hibiscus syriacus]
MVGCELFIKEKTDWLSTLLRTEFFGPCSEHRGLRKNEKNVFCIDCSLGFCRHCEAHSQHLSLQICKYVYQDVARLQEMQKHIDCSKIQTYKINGAKAVHLNPRPQTKDAKPSTKSKTGAACEACGRYLQTRLIDFVPLHARSQLLIMQSLETKPVNSNCRYESSPIFHGNTIKFHRK